MLKTTFFVRLYDFASSDIEISWLELKTTKSHCL